MDVYQLDPSSLGTFDIVLFLGVFYHLKHPLLALEKICACTRDRCIIESYVTDGHEYLERRAATIPSIEFYERGELSGQLDNWCGPTVGALSAMARTAGFACTEVLRVVGTSACIAAYRKWQALPPEQSPPPILAGLSSHRNKGISFQSDEEEYIALWCQWSASTSAPHVDDVFPEVDSFGVSPLSCTVSGSSLLVNFRLPPGLKPGLHHARIKIADSRWSEVCGFHVDLPLISNEIGISSLQDGVSWQSGVVDWESGGWVTVWVTGLSREADAADTAIRVSGIPHPAMAVFPESGQVNFRLRPLVQSGTHDLEGAHRGVRSPTISFEVSGSAPPIRGLESLTSSLHPLPR